VHGLDLEADGGRRPTARRPRIALYSHDTQGLGHVRRNLGIAGALAASELSPEILLLSGTPYARAFDLPPRTDCLILPSLRKSLDGSYAGRLDTEVLIPVRAQAIAGALEAFRPDLLVVDKVPRGAFGELESALQLHRSRGGRAVLGLRDVLDAPDVVAWEWQQMRGTEAVAEHYDAVWVYGDPRVYDPVAEYAMPTGVADKVHYTGYLAPRIRQPRRVGSPLILGLLGGGQDGYALARSLLDAKLPPGATAVVVTGPYMPADQRQRLERSVATRPDRRVVEFVPDTGGLIAEAAAVVAMGGYNTVCEILASGVPALIVPRTVPRREQQIRAERLEALGVVETCPVAGLTPQRISRWVDTALHSLPRRRAIIDTEGLAVIPDLAASLCRTAIGAGRAAS